MKKVLLLFIFVTLYAFPKFLTPDEAFKSAAIINQNSQIEAKIDLAKGIYLYEDEVKLEVKGDGVSVKSIDSPKSVELHEDMVYLNSPSFIVYLQDSSKNKGVKDIEFIISYQGCSQQGLCYEPLSKRFKFTIDTTKLSLNKSEVKETTTELSQTDAIANTIKSGNILVILVTFFGFGFLLSLTPCVFPMIPIISGLIVSQGNGITTKRAFFLSIVYVLAMAIAYTIAGVLAGLFGANLQAALQNPYVIYSFAAIFVALALSMFGYFELKLPDSIVTKVSSSQHKSGVVGVAIMGFLSALIVGPCVAAPLAGALVYIGQTGDAILGGLALFSMSIGMGLPLIVVGVSAGKFMPKPGAWMTMVSAIFGVIMLVVAIWMLERVVDSYIIVLLYSFVGIGSAIYMGVFDKETQVFKRTFSVILFIYSIALFVGVLGGSTSMTKPLEFLKGSSSQTLSQTNKVQKNSYITVTSIDELDEQLEKNKGKKIMVDFTAKWCAVCKELEKVTFSDENVISALDEFVFIKADITENSTKQKALSAKYGVFGPPVLLFFDKNLNHLESKKIVGFIEPTDFLEHLKSI